MSSEQLSGRISVNASAIKYLACLFMLIDHIGLILLPDYLVLRCIGRLAFPLFAFMIANGYRHTANPRRYLARLLLFAVGFQWFFGQIVSPDMLNILFTLALGLCSIWLADTLRKKIASPRLGQLLGIGAALLIAWLAQLIHCDYGWYGVGMIFTSQLFFTSGLRLSLAWLLLTAAYSWSIGWPYGAIQMLAVLSLPLVRLYNGKRGNSPRWFFYVFYPTHLILLHLIRLWLF